MADHLGDLPAHFEVWEILPEVGSHTIYEIGKFSIIVVRTSEGIRAHHNVCRHRGRRLCDHAGHAPSFICPFHGFSWNLDGSLRDGNSGGRAFCDLFDGNNFGKTIVQLHDEV